MRTTATEFMVYYCCDCRPPLRAYLLDGKFFVATALASTLTKLCVRYVEQVQEVQSKNVCWPV